jgi:two-component system NarL family sensor kinase
MSHGRRGVGKDAHTETFGVIRSGPRRGILRVVRSTSILLFLLLLPVGVHAQSSLDSMLRILPGQRGAERAITLTNIGYETALSDAAKGKVHVDEAVAIATAIGDSALLATCLNDLALIEHRLGHFRPAIAINHRVLRMRRTLKDTLGIAASHSKIGAAWVELVQFDSALVHNQAAERIYHMLGDRVREAMLRGNSGRLYQQMGDMDKAEVITRQAVDMLESSPPGYPKANVMGQLATLLQERGKEDESLPAAQKALELYQALDMWSEMGSMANIIGVIMENRGDGPEALRWFTQAQAWSERGNDVSGQATFLANMAKVHGDAGRLDKAIPLLDRSMRISEENGYTDQLIDALEIMVPLLEQRGDVREALRRYEQMVGLKDSLYVLERVKALSDMQVKYETERTENELLETRARSVLQREQLARQRLRIVLLIAGIALILLAAGLIVTLQRARHRSNLSAQVIAERERGLKAVLEGTDTERKRIAIELHDGVGQQLAGLKYRLEGLSAQAGPANDNAQDALGDMLAIVDDASRDVRGIAHRMMPRALGRLGLVPALEDMLRKSLSSPGMRYAFESHGLTERLPSEVEIGVFRIAQELVANALKHANASEVHVELLRNKGQLVMIMEDDGQGFDPTSRSDGMGMQNMKDRARVMQAIFSIEPGTQGGTIATLRVPLQN